MAGFYHRTCSPRRYLRDYRARRLARAIEDRPRLPSDVNFYQCRQMPRLDGLPNAVAFEGHHVVGIVRGIGQGPFPQTFGIGGLSPGAVIAFVDDALKRNPGLLQGADMVSHIHEQSGIRRKLFEPERDLGLELVASAHVDLSFFERHRSGAPD